MASRDEAAEAYCGGHKKRNVAVEAAEGIVQMSPVTVMLGCVLVAFALPVVIRRLPSVFPASFRLKIPLRQLWLFSRF